MCEKDKILSCARQILELHEYKELTIKNIMKICDISKEEFYKCFSSKQDMLSQLNRVDNDCQSTFSTARERIAAKAYEIFTAYEYDTVSMKMLARAVGLSRTSLYRYFPNKEALLESCLALYIKKRKEQNTKLLECMENALQVLDLYVNNGCEYVINQHKNYMLAAAKCKVNTNKVMKDMLQEHIKESMELLIKALEQGKGSKQIDSNIESAIIAKLVAVNFAGLSYCYSMDLTMNIYEVSQSFMDMLRNKIIKCSQAL